MSKRKTSQPTVQKLLDTAETIVARDGLVGLTYDRVSKDAGVAKGTVLYHFASKEDLITAVIERLVSRFDAALSHAMSSDPDASGRAVRAYIAATHEGDAFTGEYFDRVNGAITAALANTPERLAAVQAQGRRHQDAIIADSPDPVLATIVRMAIDGLWFAESLGLMNYDPALKAAVLTRLKSWTYDKETAAANDAPKNNEKGEKNAK